jgi:hypothetical protein
MRKEDDAIVCFMRHATFLGTQMLQQGITFLTECVFCFSWWKSNDFKTKLKCLMMLVNSNYFQLL